MKKSPKGTPAKIFAKKRAVSLAQPPPAQDARELKRARDERRRARLSRIWALKTEPIKGEIESIERKTDLAATTEHERKLRLDGWEMAWVNGFTAEESDGRIVVVFPVVMDDKGFPREFIDDDALKLCVNGRRTWVKDGIALDSEEAATKFPAAYRRDRAIAALKPARLLLTGSMLSPLSDDYLPLARWTLANIEAGRASAQHERTPPGAPKNLTHLKLIAEAAMQLAAEKKCTVEEIRFAFIGERLRQEGKWPKWPKTKKRSGGEEHSVSRIQAVHTQWKKDGFPTPVA
jgi:hypothetical protein